MLMRVDDHYHADTPTVTGHISVGRAACSSEIDAESSVLV